MSKLVKKREKHNLAGTRTPNVHNRNLTRCRLPILGERELLALGNETAVRITRVFCPTSLLYLQSPYDADKPKNGNHATHTRCMLVDRQDR